MTQLRSPAAPHHPAHWTVVCRLDDILPGSGVCARVGQDQVAIFRVAGQVFAVSNRDPFTQANVLSRGLTGSYRTQDGERYKVASPLLKHTFDLQSGVCLSDNSVRLSTWAVKIDEGHVWIGSAD
ncbi:nitrite reductase small subunit NirD [Deinococcus sonorensis]|uniref:Nitrite reductase small subunit NirD n=2 Tax=Deinococcus sonorensis TaxID=309891 RepID=A0AAU7U5H6_9DEIO